MVLAVPREDATVVLAIDVSGSMRAVRRVADPPRCGPSQRPVVHRSAPAEDPRRTGGLRLAASDARPADHRPRAAQEGARQPPTQGRDGDGRRADAGPRHRRGDPEGRHLCRRLCGARDAAALVCGSLGEPRRVTVRFGRSGQPDGQPIVASILLSDGANSVGQADPIEAADRAATLGVPIYTIALGTPDGQIDVRNDVGQLVTVDVPPDTETLKQIADTTGAKSFDAPTAGDLKSVYDNLQSRIGYTQETQEVTVALVAAGLILVDGRRRSVRGLVRPPPVAVVKWKSTMRW